VPKIALLTVAAEFSRENAMAQEFYAAGEQTRINKGDFSCNHPNLEFHSLKYATEFVFRLNHSEQI